ncbi:MAG: hypothetical protein HXO06_08475 [Prevotella salivae]|nr:hypothetical protein [Segatella salivae]
MIRSVNDKGILEKYTLKEVQDLVDKLGTKKDENGRIKYQEGFNNASYILMQMYNDTKYNDEKENFIKELNDRLRVNKEDVRKSLEVGLEDKKVQATNDDIESEGLQVSGESGDNKGRETGDDAIKFNLNGQEVTMSKTDVEKDKEMSKGVFLKSYDVNDNKEEYVEYKEN